MLGGLKLYISKRVTAAVTERNMWLPNLRLLLFGIQLIHVLAGGGDCSDGNPRL